MCGRAGRGHDHHGDPFGRGQRGDLSGGAFDVLDPGQDRAAVIWWGQCSALIFFGYGWDKSRESTVGSPPRASVMRGGLAVCGLVTLGVRASTHPTGGIHRGIRQSSSNRVVSSAAMWAC